MFILDNIDPWWFFISLFVGLFIVYSTTPNPDIIVKYPTPENADTSIFRDDGDNCYKFTTTEVSCDSVKDVNEIPIQKKIRIFP